MIRRLLLPLILIPFLLGCSRSRSAGFTPVAVGFSCTAEGTYRGEAVAGRIERTAAGLLTLSLTKPDELNGLTMVWDGQAVTMNMLGMSWALDSQKIPKAALGERLLQALDGVVYGEAVGTLTEDGRCKTTGQAADASPYTLYSDSETGALLSLSMPSEELELVFSDFSTSE